MRIAFLIRTLETGGAERQLTALAKGLSRRGHRVLVVAFYAVGPWSMELEQEGVRVLKLGKRGFWDVPAAMLRLRRILKDFDADILHSYMLGANVMAALIKPFLGRTRVVFGIRAAYTNFRSWRARLLNRIEAFLSRAADAIICNSRAAAELCRRSGYDSEKLIVIPNGIDMRRFRPDRIARELVRNQWSIGEEDLLVGMVARIDAMKDHVTFLYAAAIVARSIPQARFVCVGDGEDPALQARLLELTCALELGSVLRWEPARTDPESVYAALDLGVLASQYNEGFSNAIAEGMACGVPFVATDVGDAARLIAEPQRLVPPRRPEELGRAIIQALRDDPRRAGEGLRETVERNYSLDALAVRTEAQLAAILVGT